MSIHSILKQYWGYDTFRPMQEDIINTVLAGKDCLALLPTGGGKSLCFQVPAFAREGLCLVVSPLIALMKDQVENLRKKNITAFAIHSGLNRKEVKQTLEVAGNSNCKFLYVSPERLETNLFKEYLLSLHVQLIAVDEAHCISQWGYDFRPSYLKIASLREELPGVPILALTASATPEVQKDICDKLLFGEHQVFRQSFERPNLSYSVFQVASKINKIIDVLGKVEGTAIVYCKSRKKTREISELLNMNGISADFYHAGLLQEDRNRKQEAWLRNQIRTIVCTNAFGMGIDKPEVRVVLHADIPECLENYYQEAGRAGRDGKRSYAVLLYSAKETDDLKNSVNTKFPGTEEIRKIYKSLMNYLQVPAGSGEGNYYEFDLTTFIKNFKHAAITVVSTLKILEQEGLLYFNEQVFLPSRLQVIAVKERLYEFERLQPALEPVLKTLLRTYEGIIDQEVNIYERMIAASLRTDLEAAIRQIKELQAHGIVKYVPQKEKPQVYLIQNRVRAEDLKINTKNYNKRKQQFISRIDAMCGFVYSSATCRSKIIGNYFGDDKIKDCGMCDNCLARLKRPVNNEEFEKIYNRILTVVSEKPASITALLLEINEYAEEKTREVLRFLQAEEKIEILKNGQIKSR